ncbi:MAG: SEC-C domain-containing protein [Dorea sp.]|nr:SEC-C domain-containing protein [Dorea sp.]
MARVGRNDPCPCGSGLKYKHCCMKKKGDFVKDGATIQDAIKKIVYDQLDDSRVSGIVYRMQEFMMRRSWIGAGMACTACLYVALKEAGYPVRCCVGEVNDNRGHIFDHSWVEFDGKVIDLGCSVTYLEANSPVSPPIVLDQNLYNGEKGFLTYGVYQEGIGKDTQEMVDKSIADYMSGYNFLVNGLWSVVENILGEKIKVEALKTKYADEHFEYVKM